jgi:hypothetical protein
MLDRPRWHPSITNDVVIDACRRRLYSLDNPGFCLNCGLENGGCEPDARRHVCEGCGAAQVYGSDELLMALDWPTSPDVLPGTKSALWSAYTPEDPE